jgi:hypothetical protein
METDPLPPPPAPVDALRAEAAAWAVANPPSRVLATVVMGVLTFIGWLAGRSYLALAGSVRFAALAVTYGYRKGAKAVTEPKRPEKFHVAG